MATAGGPSNPGEKLVACLIFFCEHTPCQIPSVYGCSTNSTTDVAFEADIVSSMSTLAPVAALIETASKCYHFLKISFGMKKMIFFYFLLFTACKEY